MISPAFPVIRASSSTRELLPQPAGPSSSRGLRWHRPSTKASKLASVVGVWQRARPDTDGLGRAPTPCDDEAWEPWRTSSSTSQIETNWLPEPPPCFENVSIRSTATKGRLCIWSLMDAARAQPSAPPLPSHVSTHSSCVKGKACDACRGSHTASHRRAQSNSREGPATVSQLVGPAHSLSPRTVLLRLRTAHSPRLNRHERRRIAVHRTSTSG
mmetsp:Transcript_589/g.2095  ORF Transcript_589/g.2095 Transcript_589/m.2095 type:complete len:214 (-) Transcript_589:206-847(-)